MHWTEDLSVGIEKIDGQHRELIDRINDLVAAVRQSVCKYKIGDVIRFLEDYIVFHFGEEEHLMKESGYPGYEYHRMEHKKFVANFSLLKSELATLEGGNNPGSYDLSVETNHVVVDWILDHIAKTDKKLGEYLKGKESSGHPADDSKTGFRGR